MRLPDHLLLLLVFLSVAIQTEAIHRINLIRHSMNRSSTSLKDLANRLKLNELKTNRGWYFAEITIGTPPQTFRVSFETFHSYAYVPSVNCTETEHHRYNSSQSETFEKDGRFVRIDREREGYLGKDKLCIGGICVKNQTFVELTKDDFIIDFGKVDGFIGLAFPANSSQESPFFQTLFDQGMISSPTIGLYLNKTAANGTFGGELSMGDVDPDRFCGPLNWVPTHHFERREPWRFNLDKIMLNDVPVTCLDGCNGVLGYYDKFVGPTRQIDALFPKFLKESNLLFSWYFLEECTKEKITALPVLSFVIGGEKYEVRGEEYMLGDAGIGQCLLLMFGENYSDGRWILGEPITKNYYTAYDYKQKLIGFAKAKN